MVNRDKEKLKRLWQDILSDVKKVSSTKSAALDEYGYVQKQLRLNALGAKTHSAVVISGSKIWITVRERQALIDLVISRTTFLNECRELDKELCRDEIGSV